MRFYVGLFALLSVGFYASVSQADDKTALLESFAGQWQGSGIMSAGSAGEGAIDCRLDAAFVRATLQVTAECGGAAKGAHMTLTMRWSDAVGKYIGEMTGGLEKGRSLLNGKQQGEDLFFKIESSDGSRSNLMIAFEDSNHVRVLMTAKQNGQSYTMLDLPENPLAALEKGEDIEVRFIRFRPPKLERTENGITLSLPHIRLDRTLEFLLGDKLA
jgi:hypothetical protein